MKVFDSRWKGDHGIGRFATEVHARLTGFADICLRGRPSSALDPVLLQLHLQSRTVDLFFSPGYNAPLASPCPFVFCIHDLNHLFVEENSSGLKRAYYRHVIRPAIHRARVVLTVSEFSRRAICEWGGVRESRVLNVSNGVSAAFSAAGPVHRRERPYFLYVGNFKAHKNVPRLLRAFAASGLGQDHYLLSTGTPTAELVESIRELGLVDQVVFAGRVRDEELAALYRGAVALAFVSLYEGFGLPIVEAMACGAPVLTSTAASLPEIAGDAAMLVDPLDVDAIAAGLQKLASDPELRESLRCRGLRQATGFSWDATAQRVQQALLESR